MKETPLYVIPTNNASKILLLCRNRRTRYEQSTYTRLQDFGTGSLQTFSTGEADEVFDNKVKRQSVFKEIIQGVVCYCCKIPTFTVPVTCLFDQDAEITVAIEAKFQKDTVRVLQMPTRPQMDAELGSLQI